MNLTPDGLPLHPLVVHGVIVLLPLAALGVFILIARPKWRHTYQWLLLFATIPGAVGTYLAKTSGDSLAAAVGLPEEHAQWGFYLLVAASAFSAIIGLWIFSSYLKGFTWFKWLMNAVASVMGLVIISLTYLAGHSGAESVWREQLDAARQPPPAASTITAAITMDEVAKHKTPEDCWSVVNGSVYDLTDFIARHPAGAGAVIEMCGRDATDDFVGEHGGQAEPEEWLAVFRIGDLAT